MTELRTLSDAQATVDALVDRKHPIVWKDGSIRRVLDPSLTKSDQSLLLLYSASVWVDDKDLASWVEYSSLSQFRQRVIHPLHESRLLEYDKPLRRLKLTPKGSGDVEKRLLPKYVGTP